MLTLCPAGSTQPVAASGWALSGEAATQIVCVILFSKVTTRLPARATTAGAESPEVPAGPVAAAGSRAGDRAERAECGLADGIEAITAGWAVSGAAADGAGPAAPPAAAEPGPATGVPVPAAQAASSSATTA